ncbi:RNA methyltransferase [Thermodesulfobacteriota bacterium]
MKNQIRLENISIVLVEPQIPENIGAAARAMNNMGIKNLILVSPKNVDRSRILKTATGSSSGLIERMELFKDIRTALDRFSYVVGTTARIGSHRPALTTPRSLAESLIPVSQKNLVAILFGPEDRGLSNKHLTCCHTITTIPTADFASLNLAHAVMVICYELLTVCPEKAKAPLPRLANKFELEGMYDHLRDVLTKIGFLDPQNPEHWMLNLRRFLSRMPLRAREVRVIRGICRQMDWYSSQLDRIKNKNGP